MTKRRLLNKKAYDEITLLKKLLKGDEDNVYIASIQVDENGTEGFVVEHYVVGEWKGTIVGENYTMMSKMIIEYLDKQNG